MSSPNSRDYHEIVTSRIDQQVNHSHRSENFTFEEIKARAVEPIIIKNESSPAGAGLIIISVNSNPTFSRSSSNKRCLPGLDILLVEEKGTHWKPGLIGFPKGKSQYKCSACQIKNCSDHQDCQSCSKTEQLCGPHWHCVECRRLKEKNVCDHHTNETNALHDGVTETRIECAFRETLQETGLDYHQLPHAIIGVLNNVGKNSYFIILSSKYETMAQEDEIKRVFWTPIDQLMHDLEQTPSRYNMGIRKIFQRHAYFLNFWTPLMTIIYDNLPPTLLSECESQKINDHSIFLWITINSILQQKKRLQ